MIPVKRYYLSLFLRRLPYFLLVASVISGIGITLATVLPSTYTSEAQITIEGSQIPDKLAGPTVSTPAIEQLQIFQQRLLTRPNVLAIAKKLDVLRGQAGMSADEIVKAMLDRTSITSTSGRDQATIMTISFDARTAQLAAGVVNEYLTLILQDDARVRTDQAGQTLDFFNQQVAQLSAALDAQNAKILAFKHENADSLPENLRYMRDQQQLMQAQLNQNDRDTAALVTQRNRLLELFSSVGHTDGGDVRSPEKRQLDTLKEQLSAALAIYSDTNPRVKLIQAQVDQMQKVVDAQTPPPPPGGAAASAPKSLMDIQLSDVQTQMENLSGQRSDIIARQKVMEAEIAKVPANALVLDGLQRDYDSLQGQYNAAVANQAQANTGEKIATLSRGERITVIEQPAVPTDPVKPRRVLIAGGGIGMGLLAGFGLVLLMEVFNKTIRRPVDLVNRLGITPIATIPYLRTRREVYRRRALRSLVILLVLALVPAIILAINAYYMPLDLLGQQLMDKFGIRG